MTFKGRLLLAPPILKLFFGLKLAVFKKEKWGVNVKFWFCDRDQLMGLGVAGGDQILSFPIGFRRRLYNTLALPYRASVWYVANIAEVRKSNLSDFTCWKFLKNVKKRLNFFGYKNVC